MIRRQTRPAAAVFAVRVPVEVTDPAQYAERLAEVLRYGALPGMEDADVIAYVARRAPTPGQLTESSGAAYTLLELLDAEPRP